MIITITIMCLLLIVIGIGYVIEWNYEQKDMKESLKYEMKGKRHER